jgi:D-3-phosphoglycerate dehydrogenase
MILLARQIGDRNKEIHAGNWQKTSNDCHEVRGKTLGIIGYGRVGSYLGILAEALSLKVIFFDTLAIMPIGRAESVGSLNELLAKSDFVSVNVSSLPENEKMIGRREIAMMKEKSFLINTSFGKAVNSYFIPGGPRSCC